MSWAAVQLELSDGRTLRFGPDEADAGDIPSGIQFDTTIPGGFGSASITLPRPADLYADDAKLFSSVKVYGENNRTWYEGMVVGVPQVGTNEIQLQVSGWATVLDRFQTFREVFVDRDLGNWQDESLQHRINTLTVWNTATGPTVEWDNTSSGLTMKLDAGRVNPVCTSFYDAGAGNEIGSIYYSFTSNQTTSSHFGDIRVSIDDLSTTTEATGDVLTGTNTSGSGTFTPTAKYRYGALVMLLGGTVGSKDVTWTLRLAVFGNHGLTKRGTAPDQGYYASDIVEHAIGQTSLSTSNASIEQTAFVIPHLVFREDVAIRSVIEQVTALGGNSNVANDWGVYEDREFFWRSPGTYGREWHVRRDQVATSQSDGPDADRRVAGVKINYTDGAGRELSVGPPGSNADYETTDLLDSDPDNPAHRISGAFRSESVGITSQQGAINIGVMILNESNRLDWRGSVEIQGEATDELGNTYPAALIRAGDRIVLADDPDTTPRPIASTSYDHETLTTRCDVGARPDSLEALLGQLAAVTDLVVQ